MKKIVMILAALAFAGVAGAAQVQWNVTGIGADPNGTAWNAYKLYLCDASVYSASVLAADLAQGKFDKLSESGFVLATANTAQQGTAANAKIATTYKGGDFTAGESYTFYTLVLNAEGSAATYYTISADVTKTAPSTGFMQMTFGNLSANAQSTWTTAAPEPTSGLLLLLGMAGLALRRKRV